MKITERQIKDGIFDDDYAAIGHDHDGDYAAIDHNHDTIYASIIHNHDTVYAKLTGWASRNKGMIFDGTDDKLEVPHSEGYEFKSSDFTIEIIAKFMEHKDSYFIIYLDGTSGFIIQTSSSGELYPRLKPAGGSLTDYAGSPITTTLNKKHHIAMTFDRDGNYIGYLDGIPVNSIAISGSAGDLSSSADMTINTNGSVFCKNELTTIRFYDRVLTAAEVMQLYNNGDPVADEIPYGLQSDCIFNLCGWGKLGVIDCAGSNHGNTFGNPVSITEKSRPVLYKDVKVAITSNTTLTGMVPEGYLLKAVAIRNHHTSNAVTLSVGTSGGGTQVVNGAAISAESVYLAVINQVYSASTAQDLYIHSSSWNSTTVSILITCEKVTEKM